WVVDQQAETAGDLRAWQTRSQKLGHDLPGDPLFRVGRVGDRVLDDLVAVVHRRVDVLCGGRLGLGRPPERTHGKKARRGQREPGTHEGWREPVQATRLFVGHDRPPRTTPVQVYNRS